MLIEDIRQLRRRLGSFQVRFGPSVCTCLAANPNFAVAFLHLTLASLVYVGQELRVTQIRSVGLFTRAGLVHHGSGDRPVEVIVGICSLGRVKFLLLVASEGPSVRQLVSFLLANMLCL